MTSKRNKKSSQSLDQSESESEEDKIKAMKAQYLPSEDENENSFQVISDDEEETKKGFFSQISSYLGKFTKGNQIEEKDLKEILAQMKNKLINKNVSESIAAQITSNLYEKLKNQ